MATTIPLPKTSGPAEDALSAIGVFTLNQLAHFTEKEILALHGMGPKAIRILKEELQKHGMGFRV